MQPGQINYDRSLTVFSPDGRLFQVEYARECVKKGSTTIGLKYKNGVILIVDKISINKLVEQKSIEKVFIVDETIAGASSGLAGDSRILIDKARKWAQNHKLTYGEIINIESLAKQIGDHKQAYTQYGGGRPFGVSLLIGGYDDLGIHLLETDPSGAITSYKATCIGAGKLEVIEVFEKEFVEDMDFENALELGIKALKCIYVEDGILAKNIEVSIIEKGVGIKKIDEKELEKVIKNVETIPLKQ